MKPGAVATRERGAPRRGRSSGSRRLAVQAAAGSTLREQMFPVIRRAIERVYARTGTPVPREAVVDELLVMPEAQDQLVADAAHHSGAGWLEWAALRFLLAFDQSLLTGRLVESEARILRRVVGRRGTWTYQPLGVERC